MRKFLLRFIILAILFFVFFELTFSQSSSFLDYSFGNNGIITTAVGNADDGINAIEIQSDGKIVTAGYSYDGSGEKITVARYLDNGALDLSFNSTGVLAICINGFNDVGKDLVIQQDGKIVVAGYTFNGYNDDFAIVRLNMDGSIDSSFSHNGHFVFPFGDANDRCTSIISLNDGSFIAAGSTYNGYNHDLALVKLTSNGFLDSSFGDNGIITLDLSTDEYIESIALQPDGKLLVAGNYIDGIHQQFFLVRFTLNGQLDLEYDYNGIKMITNTYNHKIYSLVIQNDNKAVVGGFKWRDDDYSMMLQRFDSEGDTDPSFGNIDNGIFNEMNFISNIQDLKIMTDGSIISAGNIFSGSSTNVFVVRFSISGTIDKNFGDNGILITNVNQGNDNVNALAIQDNGKIILAGNSFTGNNYDFMLLRYSSLLTSRESNSLNSNSDMIHVYPDGNNINIFIDKIHFERGIARIYDLKGSLVSESKLLPFAENKIPINGFQKLVILQIELDYESYVRKVILN